MLSMQVLAFYGFWDGRWRVRDLFPRSLFIFNFVGKFVNPFRTKPTNNSRY